MNTYTTYEKSKALAEAGLGQTVQQYDMLYMQDDPESHTELASYRFGMPFDIKDYRNIGYHYRAYSFQELWKKLPRIKGLSKQMDEDEVWYQESANYGVKYRTVFLDYDNEADALADLFLQLEK